MQVNNPIMEIMVLVINVAAVVVVEGTMVEINVVEVPPTTEIPTDECKPIKSRSIFKSRSYLYVCACVWQSIAHIRLVKLSFFLLFSFCLSFVRINRHFLYLPSEHLLVFFFHPYFTDFDCCSRAAVLLSLFFISYLNLLTKLPYGWSSEEQLNLEEETKRHERNLFVIYMYTYK